MLRLAPEAWMGLLVPKPLPCDRVGMPIDARGDPISRIEDLHDQIPFTHSRRIIRCGDAQYAMRIGGSNRTCLLRLGQ
jgi:hypothetical protein